MFWPRVCHCSLGDLYVFQSIGKGGVHNRSDCLFGHVILGVFHVNKHPVGAFKKVFSRAALVGRVDVWAGRRVCCSSLPLFSKIMRLGTALFQPLAACRLKSFTTIQVVVQVPGRYFGFCRFLAGYR